MFSRQSEPNNLISNIYLTFHGFFPSCSFDHLQLLIGLQQEHTRVQNSELSHVCSICRTAVSVRVSTPTAQGQLSYITKDISLLLTIAVFRLACNEQPIREHRIRLWAKCCPRGLEMAKGVFSNVLRCQTSAGGDSSLNREETRLGGYRPMFFIIAVKEIDIEIY